MEASTALIEYGALGILALVAILAVRALFTQMQKDKEREVERLQEAKQTETERANRNEEALRELNRAVQERVIPASLEMISTTKSLIELMARQQETRRRDP
jgi:hypothetical protein